MNSKLHMKKQESFLSKIRICLLRRFWRRLKLWSGMKSGMQHLQLPSPMHSWIGLKRKREPTELLVKASSISQGKALQNSFSGKFSNYYYQLPPYAQKQADRAFEHFEQDSRYPSLEFKCVNQQKARYSIR